MSKKRNLADATLVNVRAAVKRLATVERRLDRLEVRVRTLTTAVARVALGQQR